MTRARLYWICQILGWTMYTGLATLIFTLYDGIRCGATWGQIMAATSLLGVALTHAFRAYIHRANWLSLPLARLLPRVIVVSLLMAVLVYGVATAISICIFHSVYYASGVARMADFIINWAVRFLLWSTLYFGFHFVEHHKRAEIEKWQIEAALRTSELTTLKAQMNPHFLFNSLNNLEELILEHPTKARDALSKLSALMRYALHSGKQATLPLARELDIVRYYLDIERIRFEERLQIRFDVADETLQTPVPPMLVQTLVENAVKHGISQRPEGGCISIAVWNESQGSQKLQKQQSIDASNNAKNNATNNAKNAEYDYVHIRIANEGTLSATPKPTSTGLGIHNTRERLRWIFGESSRFTLEQREGLVIAEVVIPVKIPVQKTNIQKTPRTDSTRIARPLKNFTLKPFDLPKSPVTQDITTPVSTSIESAAP